MGVKMVLGSGEGVRRVWIRTSTVGVCLQACLIKAALSDNTCFSKIIKYMGVVRGDLRRLTDVVAQS